MKLPQIYRNYSRNVLSQIIINGPRVATATIIFVVLIILLATVQSSQNIFEAKLKSQNSSQDKLHLRKTLTYLINNQGELAKSEIDAALAINPQNTYLLVLYNKVSFGRIKRIEDELIVTQKVLEVRPDYAGAWLRLSLIYDELGNDALAAEARGRANSLSGDL